MNEFNDILNNATNQANQTYASNTASEQAAQQKANEEYNNVNQQGQLVNQNAAKLSALGDQYANTDNVTDMFNKDQQTQLNNMGFDKTTLNAANQNIAQETGQLGAANNQMAAQGGTRGFNAVGQENRQQGVQQQANNAIAANTAVQQNALGQANTAAQFTGQEINAQQTSQQNAITAYNDAATQQNNVMANYANTLATMADQAVKYGGLVGSNVANIMAGASSAAQAAEMKYKAQLDVAQANEANATAFAQTTQGQLNQANTALTRQQIDYNNQIQPLKLAAQKMVIDNSKAASAQISYLQDQLNGQIEGKNNLEGWDKIMSVGQDILNINPFTYNINNYQNQISQLRGQVIGGPSPTNGTGA